MCFPINMCICCYAKLFECIYSFYLCVIVCCANVYKGVFYDLNWIIKFCCSLFKSFQPLKDPTKLPVLQELPDFLESNFITLGTSATKTDFNQSTLNNYTNNQTTLFSNKQQKPQYQKQSYSAISSIVSTADGNKLIKRSELNVRRYVSVKPTRQSLCKINGCIADKFSPQVSKCSPLKCRGVNHIIFITI